jgi:hypothetical protein
VIVLLLVLALLAYWSRYAIWRWLRVRLVRTALSLRPFGIAYVLLLVFWFGVVR